MIRTLSLATPFPQAPHLTWHQENELIQSLQCCKSNSKSVETALPLLNCDYPPLKAGMYYSVRWWWQLLVSHVIQRGGGSRAAPVEIADIPQCAGFLNYDLGKVKESALHHQSNH